MRAISLKDILKRKRTGGRFETECYLMQQPEPLDLDENSTELAPKTQLTILVHRMDLNFNDKECQVLNFTDVTLFQSLKQEKQTTQLLKTLTASVSHEMLAPLNGTIEIAEMLMEQMQQERSRQMLKMIITASRLVMCHSNDLLDYNILEHGTLVENLELASIEQAILEVLDIAKLDASGKTKLEFDLSKI